MCAESVRTWVQNSILPSKDDVGTNTFRDKDIIVFVGVSSNAPIAVSPVRVEGRDLVIEPELMQPELYYPVMYEGIHQLIKKTKDGKIEFYEIIRE
jgi:hypothetical protein